MPEYIERKKYVKLNDIIETLEHEWGYEGMREDLYNLPTADVVEVKQGYWEEYWDDDYMESFHRCSECRNDAPAKRDTYCDQVLTNYCPHCGAKMDKKVGAENDL